MPSSKKSVVIAGSSLAIFVASLSLVLGTYSLFTDQVKVSNHLVGGDLQITLKREKLQYNVLNSEGIMEEKVNTEEKDFSAPTSENIFDFDATKDKFVPCNYREATLRLSNSSSLAYNYYMVIALTGETSHFAEQLLLEVDLDPTTPTTYDYAAYLNEGLTIGSESSPIGYIKKGDSKDLKVKISFVNSDQNNDAKAQEAKFDLAIYASQKIN